MQETQKHELTLSLILITLIVLGVFLLTFFKKGSENISKQTADLEIKNENSNNGILVNYLVLLEKLKKEEGFAEKEKALSKKLSQEIEKLTEIPKVVNKPPSISNSFSKDNYMKQFNLIFGKATSSGMGEEISYFLNQLPVSGGELLALSPLDKEKILSITREYDSFASNIQALDTPIDYALASEITIEKAREMSYILKKMMQEKDNTIYAVWMWKYGEASQYIYK